MFEWTNEYSVQVGSVDAQHRTLFAAAQELHAAMSAGRSRAVMAQILNRLVDYTKTHFAHEERLMRVHNYPDFPAHKAQHDALTGRVLKFQRDFEAGEVAVSVELLLFLKNWLERHIMSVDKQYTPFMVSRRVG